MRFAGTQRETKWEPVRQTDRCVYSTCGNSAAVCWKPWTDHECVHSQMTVPACPAYCSRSLWLRPLTDRKQETGTGSKHPTDTAGPNPGTDGWIQGRLSVQTLTETQKGHGEKKRQKRSIYVPKFGSYFAFFIFKPCSSSTK